MILLVEDEAGIREALCAFLRLRGFEVHGVANKGEALAAIDSALPRFLITDIDLGDGDGRDLVDEIRRRAPELSSLVLTARPIASLKDWLTMRDGVTALQKPVRPAKLVAWLASRTPASPADPMIAPGLTGLDDEEARLLERVLSRLVHPAPIPPVERAWREGERIRLRVGAPPAAFRMRDLEETLRRQLLVLDLDLWPGVEGCTELGLRWTPTASRKSEDLAAFPSTPDGDLIEKVHEDGAWDKRVPSPENQPAGCASASGSVTSQSDGQLGRVDEERRLLWPDADHPEVDARCQIVKEQ